jgi:hypothetical protein
MISCGKPRLLKIMLYNFMNCIINYIRSSMINFIILNINQLLLLLRSLLALRRKCGPLLRR